MRRKGFTLIELLVVIGIIGILVTMLLPELTKIRDTADFTACQSNLRSISMAIATYRQDENNRMPVNKIKPVSDAAVNDAPITTNGTDNWWDWEKLGDQAMQNVWLLIMAETVAEGIFKCPSDPDWVKRESDADKYGWTSEYQFSYGMQWPYARNANGDKNPARLGTATVMLADFNPADYGDSDGIGDGGADEPSNHRTNGTNMALASGGAGKYTIRSDSLAGLSNDDIYTAGPEGSGKAGYMPGSDTAWDTDVSYEARKDSAVTLGGRTEGGEPPDPDPGPDPDPDP